MSLKDIGVALLWVICSGTAFGIFLRSLLEIPDAVMYFLAFSAFVSLIIGAADAQRLRIGIVVSAALLSFGAGILRMDSAVLVHDPVLAAKLGTRATFEGVVADAPDTRATQVRVPVEILDAGVSAKVLAIFPAHTEVFYGERVRVSGTLDVPKSFDAGAGREFNYPGYLAVQGITFELSRASLEEGGEFVGNPVVAGAYKVRELIVLGLERSLPEPHAGLAGGLVVGDKRAMGKDLTQEFQTVSLIHVVVLSGYNITIVISGLSWLLSGTSRYVRFGAGGFVALFFAVMTGFASASLRAALMALIAISGKFSGRIYRPERALVLVCTGMLLWSPYLLVFDPGFQLSFLACTGLIVFTPIFNNWFVRMPDVWSLKEILVSTSSAQIAVLPLFLYQSGNLSLVSLPANLLALIAVPHAMGFSAVAALGGLLFEPIATFIALPAHLLLSYILQVVHVLARVPFASVQIPAFSAWLLIPVYAFLFGYGIWRINKEKAVSD